MQLVHVHQLLPGGARVRLVARAAAVGVARVEGSFASPLIERRALRLFDEKFQPLATAAAAADLGLDDVALYCPAAGGTAAPRAADLIRWLEWAAEAGCAAGIVPGDADGALVAAYDSAAARLGANGFRCIALSSESVGELVWAAQMAAGVWGAALTRPPPRGANPPPARRLLDDLRARGKEWGLDDGEPARCLAACGGDPVRAIGALLSAAVSRVVESDVGFGVAPANATTLPWVVHTLVRALGARIGAAAAEVRAAPPPVGQVAALKAQLLRAVAAGEGEGAAWAGSAPPSALLALLLEFLHALPRAEVVAELEKTSRSHPWRTGKLDAAAPPDGGLSGFKLGGRTTPPPKPFGTGTVKDTPPKPSGGLFGQAAAAAAPNPFGGGASAFGGGFGAPSAFGAAPSHGFGRAAPNPFAAVTATAAAPPVPAPAGGGLFGSPSAAAAPSPAPAPAGASPNPFAGFGAAAAAPAAAPAAGSSPFTFTASNPASPTAAAAPAPAGAFTFTSSHPTSPAALAAAPADDGAARAAAAAASLSQLRTCAPPSALVQYLVAALASLPDEPSVARVRIESSGGALGGASSSAPAAAAAGPTGKKAGAPELLRVTGANSRNSSLRCDGDYQKSGTRNGRPCYNKSAAPASGGLFGGAAPVQRGCIYWDGSAWKICQDGDGTRESGWNFSQRVDTPTPPTGAWSGSRAVSESPRCYDDLRVEEISNEVAPAPPTAAAAAAGPINLLRVTGADSRNSDLNCDGVYQKSGTRNGRPCYNKNAHFGFSTAGGCIYWDGSAWKMCKDGNGMTENGWNFSQQVDTPTPPTGAWSSSRAVSEMSRIYDDLRVEEISNGQERSRRRRHRRQRRRLRRQRRRRDRSR